MTYILLGSQRSGSKPGAVQDDTLDVSVTGEDIVDVLERSALTHGMPVILRMDNGPEMTRRALAHWYLEYNHLRSHSRLSYTTPTEYD